MDMKYILNAQFLIMQIFHKISAELKTTFG